MHLGDADPAPDLGLGHSTEEPQQQDGPLALGQRRQQRPQGLPVLDEVELRLRLAQRRTEPHPVARALVVPRRLVQGGAVRRPLRRQTLQHDLDTHVEVRGDLRGPRGPPETLAQLGRRVVDGRLHLAQPARHPDRRGAVPEVPQHLTGDRRHREGQEVDTSLGLEAVHREDQAQRGHLLQVVGVLAPVAVLARDVLGHRPVARDQVVAQLRPTGAVGSQRAALDEQSRQVLVPVALDDRGDRGDRGRGKNRHESFLHPCHGAHSIG